MYIVVKMRVLNTAYKTIYICDVSGYDNVYECEVGYEPITYMINATYCVTVDAFGMPSLQSTKKQGIRRDLIK